MNKMLETLIYQKHYMVDRSKFWARSAEESGRPKYNEPVHDAAQQANTYAYIAAESLQKAVEALSAALLDVIKAEAAESYAQSVIRIAKQEQEP